MASSLTLAQSPREQVNDSQDGEDDANPGFDFLISLCIDGDLPSVDPAMNVDITKADASPPDCEVEALLVEDTMW